MPLCIDLYCGLGGWADGFIAEGYRVVGFDIEPWTYPGQLVIQDVLTLHGQQFKNAAVIVASPPCQAYSYRAMPWKRAKALPPPDNTLFEACFRIQREACEAAGRHIPMIVENVRGAQKWVGRAQWHYGSYYLWGDVPALMPITARRRFKSNPGTHESLSGPGRPRFIDDTYKSNGMNWSDRSKTGQDFTRIAGRQNSLCGSKQPGISGQRNNGKGDCWLQDGAARFGRKSNARKIASALIAKIPFPLAQHIARVYKLQTNRSLNGKVDDKG